MADGCDCDTYFKFGHCVHLVIVNESKIGGTRRLVNRSRNPIAADSRRGVMGKTRLSAQITAATNSRGTGRRGRPRKLGPALSTA